MEGHAAPPCGKARQCENTANAGPIDAEKAAAHEHVLLAIEGMTYSGCGDKLTRTLQAIPRLSNVRVSFVMGSDDFDLDPQLTKVEDVIQTAERAMGFRCVRVASNNQSVDLLMSGRPANTLCENMLAGVTQVDILNKRIVRIAYDPAIVGARSLIAALGDLTTGLAPPRPDASVSGGMKKLYDKVAKTTLATVLTVLVAVLAYSDNLVDYRTKAYISIALATVFKCWLYWSSID